MSYGLDLYYKLHERVGLNRKYIETGGFKDQIVDIESLMDLLMYRDVCTLYKNSLNGISKLHGTTIDNVDKSRYDRDRVLNIWQNAYNFKPTYAFVANQTLWDKNKNAISKLLYENDVMWAQTVIDDIILFRSKEDAVTFKMIYDQTDS